MLAYLECKLNLVWYPAYSLGWSGFIVPSANGRIQPSNITDDTSIVDQFIDVYIKTDRKILIAWKKIN
jgi:hypothetical protein